ncbi:MAG: CHAT domain-containing protein [Gemmataceae bacterium]
MATTAVARADDAPSPAERERLATDVKRLAADGERLMAAGRWSDAIDKLQDQYAQWRKLDPDAKTPDVGHALCLGYLALGWYELGSPKKGLPFAEQALAMFEQLYPESKFPNGHMHLVHALETLAVTVFAIGTPDKALPYSHRAKAIREKLYPPSQYPDGHEELLHGINHVGFLLHNAQRFSEALPYFEQALAMARKLYPRSKYPTGHVNLERALNNMGCTLMFMGKNWRGRLYQEEAVAMIQSLYPESEFPDGHPERAFVMNVLGTLRNATGDVAGALAILEKACDLIQRVQARAVAKGSEDDAFALLRATPPVRDNYLGVARTRPGQDEAAYRVVANTKSAITRMLADRAAALRSAGPDQAPTLARLRDVRRRTEALLLCGDLATPDRDRQLIELTTENDRLERELARRLPPLDRRPFAPADLIQALPSGSAFVDFFSYAGRYTAFVLAPGRPIRWVHLDAADTTLVQNDIEAWRAAIKAGRDADPPAAAKLVWAPVAKALPPGTRTLYLCPQDHLWHLPWAALPGSKPGRVLLEEFEGGIILVPYPAALLDGLARPPADAGSGPILTLAGVDYGPPPGYTPLPGTAVEAQTVRGLAGDRDFVALAGGAATAPALLAELPRARYAHLATHGFAANKEFAAEHRREAELPHRWTFQPGGTAAVPSVYNRLLAYSGLVLAGANRPTPAETGIVTGPRLADLNLENLRLCVLSACDTGHGQLIGGEGTFGLVRAFHLAGCPNVIASLWPVSDDATPALMAKFYHELWVNKRPPAEALREAQLTIYRGGRSVIGALRDGARPDFKTVIQRPAAELEPRSAADGPRRSPIKLWAGFALSGPGR